MKPFLILETGRPIDPLRRHGSFGHWIRAALTDEGSCHRALRAGVRPSPLARRVLRRFIHQARKRG